MLEIKTISFDELSDEEKENVPSNGSGKEYASYIKVLHNGKVICLHSDAMEPEDTVFYRDLSWISGLLEKCYNIGKQDAQTLHAPDSEGCAAFDECNLKKHVCNGKSCKFYLRRR